MFTSEEPFEPAIASNIKMDDDDGSSTFGVTESKFDPTQMTWTEANVKEEEIVIVSEIYLKSGLLS